MNGLSLFSGGGIGDLAAHEAGITTVAMCESDEWCRYALERLWPGVPVFEDIRTLTVESLRERGCWPIDIISGGFPCVDISCAGKGAGIHAERSGLWFEMLRLVREVRPSWVLAENVPALRTRGADIVLDGLAEAGYTAWPVVVGADNCGAPHRRKRVWIVGHADAGRTRNESERALRNDERIAAGANGGWENEQHGADGAGADVADGKRPERMEEAQGRHEPDWNNARREEETGRLAQRRGDVADSGKERRGETESGIRRGEQDAARCGDVPHSTLVGCGPRRAESGGLGGPWRWPLGPGAEQHEWERPRVIGKVVRPGKPGLEGSWTEFSAWLQKQTRVCNATVGAMGGAGQSRGAQPDGPTQPALGRSTDGLPRGIPPSARRALLRTLGNSWVPQIPYLIYRWIVANDALFSGGE